VTLISCYFCDIESFLKKSVDIGFPGKYNLFALLS